MENKDIRIARSEILKLYESCLKDLSPHSIGQWLKAKTNNEYVVVPKESVSLIWTSGGI